MCLQPGHIVGELAALLLNIDHHGFTAAGSSWFTVTFVLRLLLSSKQIGQCQLPCLLASHPVDLSFISDRVVAPCSTRI